jgi:hypothetical protein
MIPIALSQSIIKMTKSRGIICIGSVTGFEKERNKCRILAWKAK